MKEKAKKVLMWLGLGFLAALAAIAAICGFKQNANKHAGVEIAKKRARAYRAIQLELADRKAKEEVENAKRNGSFADSLRRDGAGRSKP